MERNSKIPLLIAGQPLDLVSNDSGLLDYLESELSRFKRPTGSGIPLKFCMEWRREHIFDALTPADRQVHLAGGVELLLEDGDADLTFLRASAFINDDPDGSSRHLVYSFLLGYIFSTFLRKKCSEEQTHYLTMHACGVVNRGRAFLFTGASGAGKSTMGRLLLEEGAAELLGDDQVIVTADESGWYAHGSPFGGDIPRSELSNLSAPLEAIFFLSQKPETAWSRMESGYAVSALLSSVVPAQQLKYTVNQSMDVYDQGSLSALLRDASMLAAAIPCFSLEMSLGNHPWRRIFDVNARKAG